MKRCPTCKKTLPATSEYFYKRKNRNGFMSECRKCKSARSRLYYKENGRHPSQEMTHNGGLLTTIEERAADPWKCLALDTLLIAVQDHKRGKLEAEFLSSDVFELLCEQADMHPSWIRRGIQAIDSQGGP